MGTKRHYVRQTPKDERHTMIIYGIIWILVIGASATTIVALAWWLDAGGMQKIHAQSRAIFDLQDDDTRQTPPQADALSTRGD